MSLFVNGGARQSYPKGTAASKAKDTATAELAVAAWTLHTEAVKAEITARVGALVSKMGRPLVWGEVYAVFKAVEADMGKVAHGGARIFGTSVTHPPYRQEVLDLLLTFIK